MDEMKVTNGDITLRVEVTGDGPTVLCVPGWPELASSYHHQVDHLAANGYRVAALDVRGYGGSSVPTEVERYSLKQLTGDVAAVAAALDDGPIILVGHDWGAPIVWNTAIRHPDRVRAVAGLSVPHMPPIPVSLLDLIDQVYADRFFYMLYFAKPGVPEAAFGADMRAALKRIYFALSGDAPLNCWIPEGPRDAAFLPLLPDPPDGPLSFLSDAESRRGRGVARAHRHGRRVQPLPRSADRCDRERRHRGREGRSAVVLHRGITRSGAGVHPRRRRLRRPGIGMHRLPRQHDHRRRRPLGASRATGRGERRAQRVLGDTRPLGIELTEDPLVNIAACLGSKRDASTTVHPCHDCDPFPFSACGQVVRRHEEHTVLSDLHAQVVAIVQAKGLRRLDAPVQLASGEFSKEFIDGKAALASGRDLRVACEAILETIKHIDFDAVGGLTMGADQFAHVIAVLADRDWFVVRKAPKGRGTNKLVEGAEPGPMTRVVLVDDVVTTGGSIQKAYDAITALGATVVAAITLVDRGDIAHAFFEALNIPYFPLVTYHDLDIEPVGGGGLVRS